MERFFAADNLDSAAQTIVRPVFPLQEGLRQADKCPML